MRKPILFLEDKKTNNSNVNKSTFSGGGGGGGGTKGKKKLRWGVRYTFFGLSLGGKRKNA